jgi:maltooligosyltrehalose synthase
VLAFARRHGVDTMIVATGRLFASMGIDRGRWPLGDGVWGDDVVEAPVVPDGTVLVDALTGAPVRVADGRLPLAALFAAFPGALLVARRGPPR